jgi:hypothetical protein
MRQLKQVKKEKEIEEMKQREDEEMMQRMGVKHQESMA